MSRYDIGPRPTRRIMRAVVVPTIALGIPISVLIAQRSAPPPSTTLAFEGITVVDVTDGKLMPGQTVVVVGNRVQTVGRSEEVQIPAAAQVIDARGHYMIPGLWDMHAHADRIGEPIEVQAGSYYKAYRQYVANGVTGIREMAQTFPTGADSFRVWQHEVTTGARIGPRALGPSADLEHNRIVVNTPDDARRVIDSLKAAGDAFVKYHDTIRGDRELFFALLREARKIGFPMVGHVPNSVTTIEAIDSGMRSIEHVNENRQCPYDQVDWNDASSEAPCAALAQAYLRHGTWLTPTLAIFYYYSPSEQDVQNTQEFVRRMHRLGVRRFLAGTDCDPVFFLSLGLDKVCHRGFSLLQEIIALHEAGLTSLEALQAATLNPARLFDATDSLGTVAPGKLADLVVLKDNPLANIRNVVKIRAVVANGRYFDRAALDAMDPRADQLAKLYAEGQPDLSEEPAYEP